MAKVRMCIVVWFFVFFIGLPLLHAETKVMPEGIRFPDGSLQTTAAGSVTDPAPVPKTGQTPTIPLDPAPVGSDGALQKGVSWPNPRFTDNGNGTVTDNLTGLIWLKNANYNSTTSTTGRAKWEDAVTFCNALKSGQCGLADGSSAGDWRLPNVLELLSLIDWRYHWPALSNTLGTEQWSSGDAFTAVQPDIYWSSTTSVLYTDNAWVANLGLCNVFHVEKTDTIYVWPVRGPE